MAKIERTPLKFLLKKGKCNILDSMDGGKAEKIALAKKKLKDFELRRNRENGFSPTPSGTSSTYNDQIGSAPHSFQSDPNGRISTTSNHSGHVEPNSSETFEMRNGTHHSTDTIISIPSTQPTACPSMTNLELENLRALLVERDQTLSNVKRQLDELNGYYTQLHAAYSELSARDSSNSGAGAQIGQLQTALSGLVAEKTGLQSELRNTKEELDNLRQEFNKNNLLSVNEKGRNSNFEKEIDGYKRELENKDRLLMKRLEELENERHESARLQTQLLTLQHDRNEAQGRLKNIYREKEALESDLKNLRKECQMKDLHIMQLSSHAPSAANSSTTNGEWNNLQAECDKYRAEIENLTTSLAAAKKEASEARVQYDEFGRHMNENIARLNKELDEALTDKHALEMRVSDLENQAELAEQQMADKRRIDDQRSSPESQGASANSAPTEADTLKKIDEAVRRVTHHWEELLDQSRKEHEENVMEKDRLLSEREELIAELQLKLRLLEDNAQVYGNASSELLSLSEQLQAEKATVSRAVAQNRELKEQLISTEDRLIKLTEEKCASDLARQTAEHQVKEYQRRLDQPSSSASKESTAVPEDIKIQEIANVQHPEPSISRDQIHQQDNILNEDGVSIASEANEDLRAELEETKRQLDEVRTELRRSHTQNEQMNQIMRQNAEDENQNSILVELGQAISRVNALAHENETLREQIEGLRFSQSVENERSNSIQASSSNHDASPIEKDDYSMQIQRLQKENEDLLEKVNNLTHLLNEAHQGLQNGHGKISPSYEQINPHESHEIGSMQWARIELEKRFAESMRRLAEMQEQCDRVEHINQQLQLENETIADHVILYQHQRRLIRERLRLKDEQMAALERERERVVTRCNELQEALMQVLGGKEIEKSSFRPRLYSHSTVDEFSGDEECIVDGSKIESTVSNESGHQNSTNHQEAAKKELRNTEENRPTDENFDRENAVKKIMDIIDDLKKPGLPMTSMRMQCKQCIGPLQNL